MQGTSTGRPGRVGLGGWNSRGGTGKRDCFHDWCEVRSAGCGVSRRGRSACDAHRKTPHVGVRLTRDRIEALLQKMAAARIVVLGDAMLDVYLMGDVARGQQMLRIDEEVEDPIAARVMEQMGAELERAMRDADALLIEDYNKGTLVPQLIERGLALAKKRGVPVVVDPKFKNFFAYRGATVFKPNRRELEQAMGAALDLAHPDALPSALAKLAVDNLLLTLGAEGMILVTKDGQISRIPTMAREVFDVSGAGDTVTAWVGTALAGGASVHEAAHIANFAAGIEVGKAGVATVSPPEVLSMHEAYFDQLGKLRREGLL